METHRFRKFRVNSPVHVVGDVTFLKSIQEVLVSNLGRRTLASVEYISCFSFPFWAKGPKYILKQGLTYSSFSQNIYSSLLPPFLLYTKAKHPCCQQRFTTLPSSQYIHSISVYKLHLQRTKLIISRLQSCRSEWLVFFRPVKVIRHLKHKIRNTQNTKLEITVTVNNVLHY